MVEYGFILPESPELGRTSTPLVAESLAEPPVEVTIYLFALHPGELLVLKTRPVLVVFVSKA